MQVNGSLNPKLLAILAVFALASPSSAALVVLTPTVDGDILDANGDSVFESLDSTGTSLSVRNFPGTVIERGVMEFDISSIPDDATINSAVLSIGNVGIANAPLTIGFRGFAGDGVLTVSDATIATTLLTDEPWTTLETRQVDLGTAFLQSQLSSTDFLGVRLQDAASNANIQFSSSESSFVDRRPSLTIDFTAVPEPNSLLLVALIGAFPSRRRRRR